MSAILILVMTLSITAQAKIQFLKPSSAEKRIQYLSHAQIWEATDLENMDLLAGPASDLVLGHNQMVDCEFESPGKVAYNGYTKKFRCLLNGEKVKVKYLEDSKANREVFSEVAATRLFWSLGFFADRTYPVQVRCLNCPEDPFEGKGPIANRVFSYATIERKHEGIEIEEEEGQGWTFEELETTSDMPPAAINLTPHQTHAEALKLLAVFIQHGDRKSEQQRLSCPKTSLNYEESNVKAILADHKDVDHKNNDEYLDENPNQTICRQPQMLIQDLGATFGGAGALSNRVSAKMNLEHWAEESVFDEEIYRKSFDNSLAAGICEGNIKISMRAGKSGVEDPIIHEAGRRFLADLLVRFKNANKVEELFRAANANALSSEYSVVDPKTGDQIQGVAAWSLVFNQKLEQILSHSCCIPDASKKKCLRL